MALTSGQALELSLDNLIDMRIEFPHIYAELVENNIDNLLKDLMQKVNKVN